MRFLYRISIGFAMLFSAIALAIWGYPVVPTNEGMRGVMMVVGLFVLIIILISIGLAVIFGKSGSEMPESLRAEAEQQDGEPGSEAVNQQKKNPADKFDVMDGYYQRLGR